MTWEHGRYNPLESFRLHQSMPLCYLCEADLWLLRKGLVVGFDGSLLIIHLSASVSKEFT